MTAACLLVRSPACSARQLQTSIVQVVHLCPTGFRKEPCERLERHKPKGLRVVLRGLGSSNAPRLPGGGGGDVTSLPDTWVGNHPGLPGPEEIRVSVHHSCPKRRTDTGLRSGLRWSGLWARMHGEDAIKAILSPWPVERPVDWTDRVNAPLSAKEFGRVRVSIERGRPFGEDEWVKRTASELRLEHTIRPEGRPPKPRN